MSFLPPPEELQPLMHTIESVVLSCSKEHPSLHDKDVEYCYSAYRKFFKAVRSNPNAPEPTSSMARREALLDEIWEGLMLREELGADDQFINQGFLLPGGRPVKSIEQIYEWVFKRLKDSATLWRKEKDGYLVFLRNSGI